MNVLVHCELLPGDHAPKHHELRIGHHVLIAGCDQRRVLEILRIKSDTPHRWLEQQLEGSQPHRLFGHVWFKLSGSFGNPLSSIIYHLSSSTHHQSSIINHQSSSIIHQWISQSISSSSFSSSAAASLSSSPIKDQASKHHAQSYQKLPATPHLCHLIRQGLWRCFRAGLSNHLLFHMHLLLLLFTLADHLSGRAVWGDCLRWWMEPAHGHQTQLDTFQGPKPWPWASSLAWLHCACPHPLPWAAHPRSQWQHPSWHLGIWHICPCSLPRSPAKVPRFAWRWAVWCRNRWLCPQHKRWLFLVDHWAKQSLQSIHPCLGFIEASQLALAGWSWNTLKCNGSRVCSVYS